MRVVFQFVVASAVAVIVVCCLGPNSGPGSCIMHYDSRDKEYQGKVILLAIRVVTSSSGDPDESLHGNTRTTMPLEIPVQRRKWALDETRIGTNPPLAVVRCAGTCGAEYTRHKLCCCNCTGTRGYSRLLGAR
jgi:hypothetical protein